MVIQIFKSLWNGISILKAFAHNNLDVNKVMKLVFDRVVNIVGKGENACLCVISSLSLVVVENFLSAIFRIRCIWEKYSLLLQRKNVSVLVWERHTDVSRIATIWSLLLTVSQTSPGFYVSAVQVFWKHCNKQFLLFPQCFLLVLRTFCHFHQIWNCCVQTLSLGESKIHRLGKG